MRLPNAQNFIKGRGYAREAENVTHSDYQARFRMVCILPSSSEPQPPMAGQLTPAGRAWAALISAIIAWEVFAPPGQLLTDGYGRWIDRNPVWPRVVAFMTALHLSKFLHRYIDPFTLIAIGSRGVISCVKKNGGTSPATRAYIR